MPPPLGSLSGPPGTGPGGIGPPKLAPSAFGMSPALFTGALVEKYVDKAITTLAAPMGVGDTTMQVLSLGTAPFLFPGTGVFEIWVDPGLANEELIIVANTGGTTNWSIQMRGAEGTSPSAHNAGAVVRSIYTARSMAQWPYGAWLPIAAGTTVQIQATAPVGPVSSAGAFYEVDASGAQVTFSLTNPPFGASQFQDGAQFWVKIKGPTVANPALFQCDTLDSAEDPQDIGNYSSAGAAVGFAVAGGLVSFKYQASTRIWKIAAVDNYAVPTANGFWNVTQWYLDPANSSGKASDANIGTSTSAPLKTWAGLIHKWGTYSPTHTAQPTITFISSQPDASDLIIYTPTLPPLGGTSTTAGVYPLINGTTSISQTLAVGSTISKNRATNTQLQCTLGAVTTLPAGTLLHNTTHESWAFIINRSGRYHITEPIASLVVPAIGGTFGGITPVDTWANSDSVDVYNAPPTVYIAKIQPTVSGANGLGMVQLQFLTIATNDGVSPKNDPMRVYQFVAFFNCVIHRCIYLDVQFTGTNDECGFINCYCDGGLGGGQTTYTYGQIGGVTGIAAGFMGIVGANTPGLGFGGVWFLYDVCVKLSFYVASCYGYNFFGALNLESTLRVAFGVFDGTGLGPTPPGGNASAGSTPAGVVWGSGTLDAGRGQILFLPGEAVATFPISNNTNNTGNLLVGGSARAWACDDGDTVTQNGNIPISAAALDDGFRTITALTGTVGVINGNNTLSGSGTLFLSQLYIGATITFPVLAPGVYFRITEVATNVLAVFERNFPGATTSGVAVSSIGQGNGGITTLSGGSTFNVTNNSTAVSATGSHFTTELAVGQGIWFPIGQAGVWYQVASITNDTNLVLVSAYQGTTSAVSNAQKATFGGRAFAPGGGGILCDMV